MSDKSELIRCGNPFCHNRIVRTEYYTNLTFTINEKDIKMHMKVDTGSTFTVIGLDNNNIKRFSDTILNEGIYSDIENAEDASGHTIRLYRYNINNLHLTSEIVFDKLQLCFSPDIKDKAILGMDILSLFEFQYIKEVKQQYGTFWFVNYSKTLNDINTYNFNKDREYINPITIAMIQSDSKFTFQDANAAYINKLIAEDKDNQNQQEGFLNKNHNDNQQPKL